MDITKIEGYKPEMTAEQQLELVKGYNLPEPDLTGYVKKSLYDNVASELSAKKKELATKMTEQEQKELADREASEALKQNYETLLKEKNIADSSKQYLAMGYSEERATEAATALANGDMAKFFEVQKKANAEIIAKAKSDDLANTPKPPVNNDGQNNTIKTKADFFKLSYEDKEKYTAENPDWKEKLK